MLKKYHLIHQEEKKEKCQFKVTVIKNIEKEVQAFWEKHNLHETSTVGIKQSPDEKFFATFPYPYMNGRLHLGHAFSASKCEVYFYIFFVLYFCINLYYFVLIYFKYNNIIKYIC